MIQVFWDEWQEYELLDSGHRKRLERFGKYIIARGEPKAWWEPDLPEDEWEHAVAFHSGEENASWIFRQDSIPREWLLHFEDLTIQARFPAASKHIGIFPEKATHWHWIRKKIKDSGRNQLGVLNLFAYTGIASLVAAAEGCSVTHVDSSKGIVKWASDNQRLSGLQDAPIRWIVEDALKFVQREVRRNRRYDAVILDPPTFGRGPKGELWKIEHNLPELLTACRQVLSDDPIFVLITMYALDQSSITIGNLLQDMMRDCGGTIQLGEIVLKPKSSEKGLPMSIFGCWEQ